MWPFRNKVNLQETTELRITTIDYLLILVREDSNLPRRIFKAVSIIQEFDGMIESITSTLITVYFNVPLIQPDSNQLRNDLVNRLSETVGSDISILHGTCECQVGNVGNEKRKAYTALLPDYKSKLSKLSSMEFGESQEI